MARLTIFEGPDGGGKTTAARAYAEATGASYVHLGPFKGEHLIEHHYVAAMMPALLDRRDVVMDRCWLSEVPYGYAFRGGADRLGASSRAYLERQAVRARALVVLCLPPWETVRANFGAKPEMLEREVQLREVYLAYVAMRTAVALVAFDYTQDRLEDVMDVWEMVRESFRDRRAAS